MQETYTISMSDVIKAANEGYKPIVIINGEYYDIQTDILDDFNEMIQKAIQEGAERPVALETNVLNAEYAAGKIQAFMEAIKALYGLDEMRKLYDVYRQDLDGFIARSDEIYKR